MNHLAAIAEARATPFQVTRYDAFKITEGRTYRLGELDAGSLGEAMNAAVGQFAMFHKDHLLIRETGEGGTRLHLFAIKRKTNARYVHKNHVTRAVHDLYAAPVCTIDGDIIQPRKDR